MQQSVDSFGQNLSQPASGKTEPEPQELRPAGIAPLPIPFAALGPLPRWCALPPRNGAAPPFVTRDEATTIGTGRIGLQLGELGFTGIAIGAVVLSDAQQDDGSLTASAADVLTRFNTYAEQFSPSDVLALFVYCIHHLDDASHEVRLDIAADLQFEHGGVRLLLGDQIIALSGKRLPHTTDELHRTTRDDMSWLLRLTTADQAARDGTTSVATGDLTAARDAPAAGNGAADQDSADAPDTRECLLFLNLWMEVTAAPHITLVAISDHTTTAATFAQGEDDQLEDWIALQQRGCRNVYFQPNETRPCNSKPSKRDMVAASCRFADVDPLDDRWPLAEERDRLMRLAVHLIGDPDRPPTAIIDSGSGFQPLWAVEREPLDATVIAKVEAETRAIEQALGAGGTHNIDRLLRVPGTTNFPNATKRKRGRGITRARLIYASPNLYTADQATHLTERLHARLAGTDLVRRKAPTGKQPHDRQPGTDGATRVAALIEDLRQAGAADISRLEHLPDELQARLNRARENRRSLADRWAGLIDDLIEAGRDSSRSGADLSLAAMLKAAGFTHLEAGLILCAFPHGKANGDDWPVADRRLRDVARCIVHAHEPTRATGADGSSDTPQSDNTQADAPPSQNDQDESHADAATTTAGANGHGDAAGDEGELPEQGLTDDTSPGPKPRGGPPPGPPPPPPVERGGTVDQDRPLAEEPLPNPAATLDVDPTEDAVAAAFSATYAGHVVYDHTEETWFLWKDGRWRRDIRRRVFHEARRFTRSIRAIQPKTPDALAKIAFVVAVERASRADPKLAVSQEIWDTDPWLLGTPGGVVDLRTGELRPAKPDDYISRYTAVTPAPSGTPAPLWQAFLDSATKQDTDLQSFLRRFNGYVLTGDVSEEVLTFFYGPGGNGKGTFLTVLLGILGDYAVALPIEVFTANSRINLEYYRAQMAGARLVTASETEAQATWAEQQIKDITGNDTPLSARHPYGRPFTFRSCAKVLIIGNHAPKLKGRSPAMERRLRIAPFTHKPPKPDPELKEKLRAEYPAILRQMIDGCLEWQKDRLGTAKVIKAATDAYFEQQDAFRRWMEERCDLNQKSTTKPGVLLKDFNDWARENGESTQSSNAFAELIDRTEGLTRTKSNGVRWVQGIALRTPSEPPAPTTPPPPVPS